MEDEKLVAAAKNGDSKAFEVLVDRYHNQLYFTALGMLRSGWDALDVCQETFLKAFSSINTLKDGAKFKAWITRILINKSNDHLRKSKRTILVEDIEKQGLFEEIDENSIDLLNAMSNLKEQTRMVLFLRHFQDLPIKEVVTSEGIPAEENQAVQELVLKFIKAQYKGDIETIKSICTDEFSEKVGIKKYGILKEKTGDLIFSTITNVAKEGEKYFVFIRMSDGVTKGDAEFQQNFELVKVNGKFLVSFVALDA